MNWKSFVWAIIITSSIGQFVYALYRGEAFGSALGSATAMFIYTFFGAWLASGVRSSIKNRKAKST